MTASAISTDKIGINKNAVVVYKSYVPYSLVDNTFVYNGTSKNANILLDEIINCNQTNIF